MLVSCIHSHFSTGRKPEGRTGLHLFTCIHIKSYHFLSRLRKTIWKEVSAFFISLTLNLVTKYSLPLSFQWTSFIFSCIHPCQQYHSTVSLIYSLLFYFAIYRKYVLQKITTCGGTHVFTLPLKSSRQYIGKSNRTLQYIDKQPGLKFLNTSFLRGRWVIWKHYCSLLLIHLPCRSKEKGKSTMCLTAITTEVFTCLPPLN